MMGLSEKRTKGLSVTSRLNARRLFPLADALLERRRGENAVPFAHTSRRPKAARLDATKKKIFLSIRISSGWKFNRRKIALVSLNPILGSVPLG